MSGDRIGHIDKYGRVCVRAVDVDTGEIGTGRFTFDALCERGYGDLHIDDVLVRVRMVEFGKVTT
jgi:hypothetical protein